MPEYGPIPFTGRGVPGPLEEAWRLRAQEEVWSARWGGCLWAAFLGVSKCYERAAREVAGRRAIDTGCSPVIVNLAIVVYHGAEALIDGRSGAAAPEGELGAHGGMLLCKRLP